MSEVIYPTVNRNYCIFDDSVNKRIRNGESELPIIKQSLSNPHSDDEIIEDLFILNQMLDSGISKEKVAELYPELSRYNQTDSPNIQTFLAGIYRKTKIPDAFGPLISMIIRNTINQNTNNKNEINYFDPNEEIGGAILDYLA